MRRLIGPIKINIYCFLIFIIISELQAGGVVIKNYSTKDGLSMNNGESIMMDSQGYIWIGTQEGLNRFDGNKFKIFNSKSYPNLVNDYIQFLFLDNKGTIWIGTMHGLSSYKEGQFTTYKTENNKIFKQRVFTIAENIKNDEHKILIGTQKGLYTIKEDKMAVFPVDHPALKEEIQAIAVDNNNNIFLGTFKYGLIVIKENKNVLTINSGNKNICNNVTSLLTDADGVWIGTDDGLEFYRNREYNGKDTFKLTYLGLKNTLIKSLVRDDDILWIGTYRGLFKLKKNKIFPFLYSKKLAGNKISSMWRDNEKGLWVGAVGGVSRINESKFSYYSTWDGLPSNICFGIYPAWDGKIWIATFGGIAVIDESKPAKKKIKSYTQDNKLLSDTIVTIAGDKFGNTWIATLGGGLIKFKDNVFEAYYTKRNGLPSNNIRVVFTDEKNRLWLGMNDSGLVLFSKEKKIVEKANIWSSPLLLNPRIKYIMEDSDKNLWIAFINGICKFKGGNISEESKEIYLENKDVTCILEDKERNCYWITTYGDGLYNLSKNPKAKCEQVKPKRIGLISNNLYKVVKDKNNCLWIPTNKGVIFYDVQNYIIRVFTSSHGLPADENNSYGGVNDKMGRIWFSTTEGVAYINPDDEIEKNKIQPTVYIEEVEINLKEGSNIINEPINLKQKKIILPSNHNNISIKFTAITFQTPEAVKFKFQLQGSPQYEYYSNYESKERLYKFDNLPPGDYKFNIIACNCDGIWNKTGDSFAFTIDPAFTQTLWFYLGCGISIFLLFFVVLRRRTSLQKKHSQKLEELVKERTAERNKIQLQLYQQDKMASLGVLVAGIAHEMNNPANSIILNTGFLSKFIEDIKIILYDYMALELPTGHKIIDSQEEMDINMKLNQINILIKFVNDGAIRISDIVKALRNFAHVNETIMKKCDIHRGIEDTLFLLNCKVKEKIEILTKFGEIPQIECNPGQINQVFMNILSNAIEAIPNKGKITIETFLKDQDNVVIKLSDTGVGISKEIINHIFEPFFTTKEKDKGTGLGLSISHSIIKDHNGKIIAEQNESEGVTFVIVLPINQKRNKEKHTNEYKPSQYDTQI